MTSNRWLAGIAAALVIVLVASVAVALSTDGPEPLDPSTPEGAVQRYLEAVLDRDVEAARAWFAPELIEACDTSRPFDPVAEAIRRQRPLDFRASLSDTRERDGITEVEIRIIEVSSSDPFGRSEYSFIQVFTLEQREGAWRLVQSPWPVYCPMPQPVRVPGS